MKKTLIALLLVLPISTLATQDFVPNLSRFEKEVTIKVSDIITPKVVRFETTDYFGNQTVLLDENDQLMAHKWIRRAEKIKKQPTAFTRASSTFEGDGAFVSDRNLSTSFAFHPEKDKEKKITFSFPLKTEISGIFIHLDDGIIPPQKISVRGQFEPDQWTNILDEIDFSHRIPFPKVSIHAVEISFNTRHFLRLNEVEFLGQEEIEKKDELIFFAEEGKSYRLLGKAHFGQENYFKHTKHQPLLVDDATPTFTLPEAKMNSEFNPDFDKDGVNDKQDLCPKIPDPKNVDKDKNGRGDVCEDPDLDNHVSSKDNCPFKYNPKQMDTDQDGIGDVCDDVENRWTENQDNLLWIVFIFGAGILGVLIYRSMKK